MSRHLVRIFGALMLVISTLAVASSTASAVVGTNYFVGPGGDDNNAGTSINAPVATLQQGAGLLGPGDTLWVLDGTYDGFSVTATGSPGNYARIAAYPGATPVIDPGGGNGAHFHDTSYVEMWGLELRGDSGTVNSPNGVGVLITGESHHIRLVQNEIHHFGAGGLITYQSGDHLEIYHNTVHNNANWNPDQHSGISLLGLVDDGTPTSGEYANFIVGNLIYTNEVKVSTDRFGGGSRVTDGNCFVVDVTLESDYTRKTLFGSNICVNNGGRGTQVYKSADVDVVNNTFYENMRTPDVAAIGAEVMAYDSTRVRFANNLIISRPDVLPLTAGITAPVTFTNNLTVGTRNPAKSASDRHLPSGTRVLANPSTNPSDLTAANFSPSPGSAAVDHGTSSYTGELPVDFQGNIRSAGSGPDAGAVESASSSSASWPWIGSLEAPDPGAEPQPQPEPQPEPQPLPSAERRAATGRLYSAAFLRAPDSAGLQYWLSVDAGLIDIAYVFTISEEFKNRYGELDDRSFVDRIYRNVLGRSPDESGFRYWTGLMDEGLTRAELLLYF
ncbi:MAG: DUF4214 domain-containing protein, partial [Acidimicrobiia bacterium]|nr:DUF4214 domain-containing protein [Acidimicrobiia bacterium]